MPWSDELGTVLFGVVEQQKVQRQRVYASAAVIPPGIAEQCDFIKLQTVGGTIFSPLSVPRFGALLDASVADTAQISETQIPQNGESIETTGNGLLLRMEVASSRSVEGIFTGG
jgi:hypothetical protein